MEKITVEFLRKELQFENSDLKWFKERFPNSLSLSEFTEILHEPKPSEFKFFCQTLLFIYRYKNRVNK